MTASDAFTFLNSNDPLSAAYEKIPDDHAPQSVVPNELIQPVSEEYWAPDPRTGVFSPHSDHNNNPTEHGDSGAHPSGSVLEEEPFIRSTSVEDLEKPIILPDRKVDEWSIQCLHLTAAGLMSVFLHWASSSSSGDA